MQRVVDDALDDGLPRCVLTWEGGAFASGETDADAPVGEDGAGRARSRDRRARRSPACPWGADMRLFTARGIPAVMVGTRDIENAHAVDESVSIDELATVARTIIRAVARSKGARPL